MQFDQHGTLVPTLLEAAIAAAIDHDRKTVPRAAAVSVGKQVTEFEYHLDGSVLYRNGGRWIIGGFRVPLAEVTSFANGLILLAQSACDPLNGNDIIVHRRKGT